MTQRKRLALIDGHALAFRAFHALREAGMRASSGEPTYAVFGFAQILLTMIQEQRPDYVAVSFDVGRTFRDDLYAEYKAGRGETPEEFHPQLERIKELMRALSIPIYTLDGYEADDVIGTLACQATAQDVETLILTGDTDSLQLVDGHVRVLLANPYAKGGKNTTLYDEAAVRERYDGLAPAQLADLRGLKGDTSDNIPGVKGIGEKGAIALLNQFGTVENLFHRLDEAPNRYKKVLDGQREAALFSKRLATIVCDAPVQLDLAACAVGEYDRAAVIRLFQELEIGARSGLLKKLPPMAGEPAEPAEPAPPQPAPDAKGATQHDLFAEALPDTLAAAPEAAGTVQLNLFGEPATPVARARPAPAESGAYAAVTSEAALEELVAALRAAPGFAFDTEASGLRPLDCDLVGISVSHTPGSAAYIPVGHATGEQLPRERVLDALRPLFEDEALPKYAHNAKFDIEMLEAAGVRVHGLTFDTMVAAALLNKKVGLKDLAFYELRDHPSFALTEPPTPIEELIGRGQKQITFDQVPIDRATPYAAADADLTLRLKEVLEPQLRAHPRVYDIFTRLEMPLVEVLTAMEQAGITLDKGYIEGLGARLGERIGELAEQIYAAAGQQFNINSGAQLNAILFDSGKFGLDPKALGLSRLKTGGYSITADVLEQMAPLAPIAELILRYRQLTKLKSTYVDALPALVSPKTGRVHTSYNQVGSATGRLSSDSPNLQNIPVRTLEGREIRRGFIAAPGCCFVAADYSQIELRVLAHYTRDPALIATFQEGRDIHATTASRLFGVEQSKVDKNQRRIAKCVAAGTLVTTERGLIPIEELATAAPGEVSDLGLVVAQEGRARGVATGFYNGGVQQTIRITTERGYVLEATGQHQVRSIDSSGTYVWRRLAELAEGEYVALGRGAMLFGQDEDLAVTYTRRRDKKLTLPTRLTPAFARFLGYYVAEGNMTHGRTSSSLVISNTDSEVLDDLRQISRQLFGDVPQAVMQKTGVTMMRWNCSRLVELVEQLGVGKGAANKRIPAIIMRASYDSQMEFLRAFFEGDGSISGSFISAASKSEGLIRQLQTLLLNLGIATRLEHRDVPNYGRHFKLRVLGREGRALFAEHIGFISSRKRERLTALLTRQVTHEAVVLPNQVARLTRMYPKTKRDNKELIHTCIRTKSRGVELTYRRLSAILQGFPEPEDDDALELRAHLERNVFYDRVVKIEPGECQVYDLVVPENNTYIANGFVSHNTVTFGIIYGISSFGLSSRLGMSRGEAQGLIDGVFASFPGIKAYIDETLAFAREHGYVTTLFGRRRAFPELASGDRGPRAQAAMREAINAPIQGTAADIMKIAMINVHRALAERGMATKMLLQVHDELILEAPDHEIEAAARLAREVMEGAYPALAVPLGVEVETGTNWEEMRPEG